MFKIFRFTSNAVRDVIIRGNSALGSISQTRQKSIAPLYSTLFIQVQILSTCSGFQLWTSSRLQITVFYKMQQKLKDTIFFSNAWKRSKMAPNPLWCSISCPQAGCSTCQKFISPASSEINACAALRTSQNYPPHPYLFSEAWYWGLELKILIRNQFRFIDQIHET